MFTLTKRFEFEAAHHLPKHKGKCKNLHGHSYKLEVTVRREDGELNNEGMVVDSGILKQVVNETIIERLDHKDLNQFYPTPTAEIMVTDIHRMIQEVFWKNDMYLTVILVELWETEGSHASFRTEVCE